MVMKGNMYKTILACDLEEIFFKMLVFWANQTRPPERHPVKKKTKHLDKFNGQIL